MKSFDWFCRDVLFGDLSRIKIAGSSMLSLRTRKAHVL